MISSPTRWILPFIVVNSLLLSSCSGSSTSSTDTSPSFAELIITKRDATNPEIWACLGDDGLFYGYTFYDRGAVDGLDAYLGMGVVLLDNASRFTFSWSASDDLTSLYLDSAPTASRDIWTDISFEEGGKLRATSGSVGPLYCSKESGESA